MTNKKPSIHFISSWSGGKDSCLALYYAMQEGLTLSYLLNMVTNNPIPSLKRCFVSEQATSINVPIIIKNTTWDNYEADYIITLKKIAKLVTARTCVFGDIDIEKHRKWNEDTCDLIPLRPFMPLWQKNRRILMQNFLSLGFKAIINVVNTNYLDKTFLGKEVNITLMQELAKTGIDICGENGEYHTIVTDGPIFSYPIKIQKEGIIENSQYCYLDFSIGRNHE